MQADQTPRHLYLNHAGTSWPKPEVVSEAIRDATFASPSSWPNRFEDAHQTIADFFGVNCREQILLTPGCTSALAVAIGDARIPPGKRVLTSRWEHHALHRPLLKRAGGNVSVEYIPSGQLNSTSGLTDLIDLQWLENALSDQDVGLVAITAACNVTGELLPVKEVIQLAHQHGVQVLIDAAQLVGWHKLNLPELGADMVAFGGHKGLQGPWGIGGLYMSEQVQMECGSAQCELPVSGSTQSAGIRPGYCDVGSVDQFALAGLHAAIKMLNQQNLPGHLDRARQQIQRIGEALKDREGLQLFGGNTNSMPSIAFTVSGLASSKIASLLGKNGLVVASGLQCSPLAHDTLGTMDSGVVRLSVGLGQPDEEIDEAIERISQAFSQMPDSF